MADVLGFLKWLAIRVAAIALIGAVAVSAGALMAGFAANMARLHDTEIVIKEHLREDDDTVRPVDLMLYTVGSWLSGADTEVAQDAGEASWVAAMGTLTLAPALFCSIMLWRWYRSAVGSGEG